MSMFKRYCGRKVDSTFHPCEVDEMSSSVIDATQVCLGCTDRQRSPDELFRQEFK